MPHAISLCDIFQIKFHSVPQGEVWSVPLFLLAINDITKCTPFPLTQRLFADDYSISLHSSNPIRSKRLLQETLNKISVWASDRGFRFSPDKTGLVIFRKNRRSISALPPLHLQGFSIKTLNSYKFLGLTFDQNLSWISHIKSLKAKCLNATNILKYLSHPRLGCNRKLLLQLYKSRIRSHLDYGSPIYSQTNKSSLQLLNTIQSSALRMVLGAFRTSPNLSLCAEAAEPPLLFRTLILTTNFLASSAQFPDLPFLSSTPSAHNTLLNSLKPHLHPLPKLTPLLPIKSSTPPWLLTPPTIRLDLINIPKSNKIIHRKLIAEIIAEYPNDIHSRLHRWL